MSILTDRPLWTLSNLNDLLTRFTGNPISGSRDFLDKLSEQLKDAPAEIPQLAAEVLWFLNLFPHPGTMKAETKREQIKTVWQWSGEDVPASPFLNDDTLGGVGNPGTAYATHRPMEFEYLIRTVAAFKALAPAEQTRPMNEDVPWTFMTWLDEQPGSERRLVRNTLLYFLFPDHIERNTSRAHKQQIYEALKNKLPVAKRVDCR
ncbi:MAG: hypothetical protein WBA66_01085 [Xanthobacteraceae bacterium]